MGVDDEADDPASRCEECGQRLDDARLRDGWRRRRPCPGCGSTRRRHVIRRSIVASEVVDADTDALPVAAGLLDLAARSCEAGAFDMTVVLAHAACEAAIQRAVAQHLSAPSTAHLEDALWSAAPGRDPAEEPLRRLYASTTGDDLEALAGWQAFLHSARLRAAIERHGVTADEDAARRALAACEALVRHVGARLGEAISDGGGAPPGLD